ncbi:protein phosphatase S phase [Scheffersomyces xylosifermentans]|uniref:protein phosphatase S phase n=1 Tax=Scheffersomyces xylosifermentans TaxID=1304137 RepID=UPI00315DCD74
MSLALTSRSSKRSSSTSNDLIYERDRFRARLQTLNSNTEQPEHSGENSMNVDEVDDSCDVCDGIGYKTAKLNVNGKSPKSVHQEYDSSSLTSVYENEELSPLDSNSKFYGNLKEYPMAYTIESSTIKSLSIRQLQHVFEWYFNKPLPPTNHMFPWLHGLNKDNFAQKSFFLYQQQQLAQKRQRENTTESVFGDYNLDKPKGIRFLMCVSASDETSSNEITLKNTVKINEILQRVDVSRIEIRNIITAILSRVELDADVDVLVQDCLKLNCLPIFLDLDPDRGISLRNFHIQVAKLSTCSDFILYGKNSSNPEVDVSMARVLWLAQRYEAFLKHNNQPQYNIFVLEDDFGQLTSSLPRPKSISNLSKIESKFLWDKYQQFQQELQHPSSPPSRLSSSQSELSSLLWENDYQIKEKIETTRMSSATRLGKNVWVGNYWDFQIMMTYLLENDNSFMEQNKRNAAINVNSESSQFDINFTEPKDKDSTSSNLPLKDLYCNAKNSIVTNENLTNNLLDYLSLPKANWRLFVYCHNDASFPDPSYLSSLLFKYTISSRIPDEFEQPEYHILEFPPSGSIGIGDCKKDNLMSIINTCKLIYLYSSSVSENALASLIYCSDGYTESSLLVICYLMYSENLSLDNAMLDLHLRFGRPFYIFNSDVLILKKLESMLRKFSPLNPKNADMEWATLETLSNLEINELLLGAQPVRINKNLKLGYIANDDDSSSSSSSEDEDDDDFVPRPLDWVKEVEGSIPSKILPYMYLGSLKHANSLTLLNKLGVKKIISVGEQLDWLAGYKFQQHNSIVVDELAGGSIEMYNITPLSPKKVNLYHHHTTVDTVMKVNNLEDDGIDELSRVLPIILKFIDDEYQKSGGQTKILIHCRVGVSRSATVVIAEVMRRLKVSLPNAYLYVRVRRLNIIIQPNLRFMYELFKWEEQQKLIEQKEREGNEDLTDDHTLKTSPDDYLREIDWFIMCREIMKLNIPYLNN